MPAAHRRAAVAALAALLAACAHEAASVATVSSESAPADVQLLAEQATAARESRNFAEAQRLHAQLFAIEALPVHAFDAACAASLMGQTDEAFNWLVRAIDQGFTAPSWLKDPDLEPLRSDPRWPSLLARMKEVAQRRAKDRDLAQGLSRTTPEKAGLDPAALKALLAEAEKAHTTGLVILRDGQLVGDWYFESFSRPLDTRAATRSVVALAVGALLTDGKLKSLDEPLWHFFPELRQGLKERLTLRQVLNHTTGVQALPGADEVDRASNVVQLALAADLVSEPGARFFENAKAVNLVAGVVERASGQRLDAYVKDRLLAPLGITDVQWTLDKTGHPHVMSGLHLHPVDFARLGQLVLNRGSWAGQTVLSPSFVDQATGQSGQAFEPDCALLWWLRHRQSLVELPADTSRALSEAKVDAGLIKAVQAVEGRPLENDVFWSTLSARLPTGVDPARVVDELNRVGRGLLKRSGGPVLSLEARSDSGQQLLVFPEQHLVIARLAEADEAVAPDTLRFGGLWSLARRLVPTKN